MRSEVLIIIPAYNEAETIENVIENLKDNYPQYDYIVVNDGSVDRTGKICEEKGYSLLNLPMNLGIGGAVQAGYRYAVKNGYSMAVQMDGDGQHDPKYLEDMIKTLKEQKAELVIGSRFVNKEGFQSSKTRRFGIGFLSVLGKILTGVRLKDITSGYRLVGSRLLGIYANDYPSDYPEPEAMVIAAIHGFGIVEYPVVMNERMGGTSSITLKRSVYYMVKVTLAMIIRRLSFGIRRDK